MNWSPSSEFKKNYDGQFDANGRVHQRRQDHQHHQNSNGSQKQSVGSVGAGGTGGTDGSDGTGGQQSLSEKKLIRALFRVSRAFTQSGISKPSQAEVQDQCAKLGFERPPGLGWTEIRARVIEGIANARFGILEGELADALAAADQRALPQVALTKDYDGPMRRLIGLCGELQRRAGDKSFFLTGDAVGPLLRISGRTARRYLSLLVTDNVLRLVKRGHTSVAPEYRTTFACE